MNSVTYSAPLPAKQPGRYGKRGTPKAFVFASDPQYPWTPASDNGLDQSASERDSEAQKLIHEQYASIADYRAKHGGTHIPVMINGDMTAFGHGWQRKVVYPALKQHLQENYYFGLGNHDYGNNVNDSFNNGAARDSVLDLIEHHQNRVDVMELEKEENDIQTYYRGSLAYSISFGRVRLVQLNNYPIYRVNFTSGWAWPFERHFRFEITGSLDWLEKQLKEAHEHGQTVLLNLHQPGYWDDEHGERKRFKAMIEHYRVSAAFAGHHHKEAGTWYRDVGHYGRVPIYLSGSASQRTYLLAELSEDGLFLDIKRVGENNWANAEQLKRLKLY